MNRSCLMIAAALVLQPRGLLAQCPDGTPPPCARVRGAPANSVAVLSFESRSRDTSDAFLAEGLADEISTRLAQLGELTVVSRTQVRRLRGEQSLDIPAMGRALNSATLVTGSVQGTPTRLRVSVELLRATTAVQVWGNVYDRNRSDLLEIQSDIATEVAAQIAGTLRPGERATLRRRPTSNPEAFEHLLRGDLALADRSPERVTLAIREYEAAVRLDPQSARAQAGLAKGYEICRDYLCTLPVPPDTLDARCRRAAAAALRLDSTSSEAWLAAAYAALARPVDGPATLFATRRALVLDSNNANAWHLLGWAFALSGDDANALTAFRRALRVDPARGVTYEHLARLSVIDRHFAETRSYLDSAVLLEPRSAFAIQQRALLRAHLGDVEGATSDATEAARLYADSSPAVRVGGLRAYAMLQAGDTAGARALAEPLVPLVSGRLGPLQPGLGVAFVLMRLGRVDEAMRMLAPRPGAADRPVDIRFHFFARQPWWDPARGNPLFEQAVAASAAPWLTTR